MGIKQKKPTFSKFLYPGYSTESLRIPQGFLKQISYALSEIATLRLKVCTDRTWYARVRKTIHGVCLEDGWHKFLEDNSLDANQALVFNYDGRMQFSIEIFDKSGQERVNFPNIRSYQASTFANNAKRPCGRPKKCHASASKRLCPSNTWEDDSDGILSTEYSEQKEVKEDEEDDSVEILSSFESSDEFKEDEEDDSAQHHSSSESSEHQGFKENDSVQIPSISESSEEFKEEEEDTKHVTYGHSKSAKPESFKSIFPHFTSTFRHPTSLRVPIAFSRAHFLEGRHANVILKNAKGKEWLVKAIPCGGTHLFSAGWPKFAYANHIIFNDICVFELVDRKRNTMVVRKFGKRSD